MLLGGVDRWAACVAVLLVVDMSGVGGQEASASTCPEFFCEADNACMPNKWLCDGEADCTGGADEQGCELPGQLVDAATAAATTADYDYYEGLFGPIDDFDFVTQAPCSVANRSVVDACSRHISEWLDALARLSPNEPFFASAAQQQRLATACQVFGQFRDCLGQPLFADPHSCLPESTLRQWESLEAYTCQLVLPSAQDHAACFAGRATCYADHAKSQLAAGPSLSGVCRLVFSLEISLDCVDDAAINACTTDSADVLSALRSETSTADEANSCNAQIVPVNTEITSVSGPCDLERFAVCAAQLQPLLDRLPVAAGVQLFAANSSTMLGTFCDAVDAYEQCVVRVGGLHDDECWRQEEPVRMMLAMQRSLCAQDVLAGARDHEACLADVEADARMAACSDGQVDAAETCGALTQLHEFTSCTLPIVGELCDDEAALRFVELIRDRLNGQVIDAACEESAASGDGSPLSTFRRKPTYAFCNEDQESSAVACLLGLADLIGIFTTVQEQQLDFIHELSLENSTIIDEVCSVYGDYEDCLDGHVFVATGGERCAFMSPLNAMARMGLSPFCDVETLADLRSNAWCIEALARDNALKPCSSKIKQLMPLIGSLIEGGGESGDVVVCRIFYMIRDIFACIEPLVGDTCGQAPLDSILRAKLKITTVGVDDGCPADKPVFFDATSTAAPPSTPRSAGPTTALSGDCEDPATQLKLIECLTPLMEMSPHPLTVVKRPKDMDEACARYEGHMACSAGISCREGWLRGIEAMFEFACGDGRAAYDEVKMCVRRLSTRVDIKTCVERFARFTETNDTCLLANDLLACSYGPMNDKCGETAGQFVLDYLSHFAVAVNSTCVVAPPSSELPPPATPLNCDEEEAAVIESCSDPLLNITDQLQGLFSGGIQSFLGNTKDLGPIFEAGCVAGDIFKACVEPAVHEGTSCQVSSCLIKAGDGVCNETDKAEAIDRHLSCVFSLIVDPDFGRCLRVIFSTLSDLSLASIKRVLPDFIDCVEEPVTSKCGAIPLNVLRAMADQGSTCTLVIGDAAAVPPPPVTPTVDRFGCNDDRQQSYLICNEDLENGIGSFAPITLIESPADFSGVCGAAADMDVCVAEADAQLCAPAAPEPMPVLVGYLCDNRPVDYLAHRRCLQSVAESAEGVACARAYDGASFGSDTALSVLSTVMDCAAPLIFNECGGDALELTYDASNIFMGVYCDDCQLEAQLLALETGCQPDQLEAYFECDFAFDNYAVAPISLIRDSSQIDAACDAFFGEFSPCLDAAGCRPQPLIAANTGAFEFVCGVDENLAAYKRLGACIATYAQSAGGRDCSRGYDEMAQFGDAARHSACAVFDSMLDCAQTELTEACGDEAVDFVRRLHGEWVRHYDAACHLATDLQVPTSEPEPTTGPQTPTSEPQSESTAEPTTESEPDACAASPCAEDEVCVLEPKQCIATPCLQYRCDSVATSEPEGSPETTAEPIAKTTPPKKPQPAVGAVAEPEATEKASHRLLPSIRLLVLLALVFTLR